MSWCDMRRCQVEKAWVLKYQSVNINQGNGADDIVPLLCAGWKKG